jgi:hypothetical protein
MYDTRWEALEDALDTVLPGLDDTLYMGLLMFPVSSQSDCAVPQGPDVAIQQPSASQIRSALDVPTPDGNTPTYQTLGVARDHLTTRSSPRPQYIVLATDGEPNCSHDSDDVVSRLSSIRMTRDIETFVLGIPGGEEELDDSLNEMAQAGGRPRRSETKYYAATSTSEFETSLRGIVAAATDCTYTLREPPPLASTVSVSQDGMPVARDSDDGWDFVDSSRERIRFFGQACTRLTNGEVTEMSVRYGC